jgi:hypothetical protein
MLNISASQCWMAQSWQHHHYPAEHAHIATVAPVDTASNARCSDREVAAAHNTCRRAQHCYRDMHHIGLTLAAGLHSHTGWFHSEMWRQLLWWCSPDERVMRCRAELSAEDAVACGHQTTAAVSTPSLHQEWALPEAPGCRHEATPAPVQHCKPATTLRHQCSIAGGLLPGPIATKDKGQQCPCASSACHCCRQIVAPKAQAT